MKKEENNEDYAWEIFKLSFSKNAKVGDTLGFAIKRKHFSIIRDDDNEIILKNKVDNRKI